MRAARSNRASSDYTVRLRQQRAASIPNWVGVAVRIARRARREQRDVVEAAQQRGQRAGRAVGLNALAVDREDLIADPQRRALWRLFYLQRGRT